MTQILTLDIIANIQKNHTLSSKNPGPSQGQPRPQPGLHRHLAGPHRASARAPPGSGRAAAGPQPGPWGSIRVSHGRPDQAPSSAGRWMRSGVAGPRTGTHVGSPGHSNSHLRLPHSCSTWEQLTTALVVTPLESGVVILSFPCSVLSILGLYNYIKLFLTQRGREQKSPEHKWTSASQPSRAQTPRLPGLPARASGHGCCVVLAPRALAGAAERRAGVAARAGEGAQGAGSDTDEGGAH